METEDLKRRYADQIRRYESYRDEKPEDLSALSYGDLTHFQGEAKDTDFFVPDILSGSDYSGSSVTVSNYRTFLKDFGKLPGVFRVYGGYSTYAVAIQLSALTEEMLEVFAALEDYPLISEDDHSEVEREAEDAAWESWAKDEFVAELTKRFPEDEDQIEALEDNGKLAQMFYKLADRANEYWVNETGNSAFIRVENVAAEATAEDLI